MSLPFEGYQHSHSLPSTPYFLNRFSYSTTISLQAHTLWTHLHSPPDDLHVALIPKTGQSSSAGHRNSILQVYRGNIALESIDLEILSAQAQWDEERMRSQQSYSEHHRVMLIIVKSPLLAIRHQLPTGQVRRVQLNFRSEDGFNGILRTLLENSLPVKRQPDRNRPQSASNFVSAFGNSTDLAQASQISSNASQHGIGLQPSYDMPYPQRGISAHTSPVFPSSSAPAPVERPFTAPTVTSQMLPPRRELPFPLPRSNFTPSSSSEQPKPIATKASAVEKAPPRGKGKSKPNTPRKRKAPPRKIAPKENLAPTAESTMPSKSYNADANVELAENWCPPPSAQPSPDKSDLVNRHSNYQMGSFSQQAPELMPKPSSLIGAQDATYSLHNLFSPQRPELTPNASSVASASPSRMVSSPIKTSPPNQEPSMTTQGFALDEYISRLGQWIKHNNDKPASPTILENGKALATYGALPSEEKNTTIDNMLCDCLEDPKFLRLVEDVQSSWLRQGFSF